MNRKSGDLMAVIAILVGSVFAFIALYSLTAVAILAAVLVACVILAVASRILRWPAQRFVVPAAAWLQSAQGRVPPVLGWCIVGVTLAGALWVIDEMHAPALRRLAREGAALKRGIGPAGDAFDTMARACVGEKRYQEWSRWLGDKDMHNDSGSRIEAGGGALPSRLIRFSRYVNARGRDLEEVAFSGARTPWFRRIYWLFTAVLVPFFATVFVTSLFQHGVRRLRGRDEKSRGRLSLAAALLLMTTIGLAWYLVPFVSHPYHVPGLSVWTPVLMYGLCGAIGVGIAMATNRTLHPDGAQRGEQGKNDASVTERSASRHPQTPHARSRNWTPPTTGTRRPR